MITVSFRSEEEKNELIKKYSTNFELVETCYLYNGNELRFAEKINGLTTEERLKALEDTTNQILLGGL